MPSNKQTEVIWERLLAIPTIFVFVLFLSIFLLLFIRSTSILEEKSLAEILFSSVWNPSAGNFGLYPMIVGTIFVTVIAMIFSIPISILSAMYISEYAPGNIKSVVKSFIDILAGIPSVVYGMCAILVLVPLVRDHIGPFFGVTTTGYCILTAGLTLAVMVFPIIISIVVEAFQAVPFSLRESSLSVGATKWETVKYVVLRKASPSVYSAVFFGFGRAFGETMAVAMVVGNLPMTPSSVFGSGMTLPSLIATTYGDMMSLPLFDSAIMFAALLLLVIVVIFNVFGRVILMKTQKR